MSDERDLRDLERRLVRTLESEAPRPDPRLAERLLARTAATRQRRGWFGVSTLGRALAATAVVLLAVAVGWGIGNLPRNVGVVSTSPSPTIAPEPSSSPTASPTASPTVSSTLEPSPTGQRCTNDTAGYSVEVPAGWFANEAVVPDDPVLDPIPACQYFGEEPMQLAPNAGLPPTVAIGFKLEAAETPPGGTVVATEELTVDDRPATVREVAAEGDGPFLADGDFVYTYFVEQPDGSVLTASTDTTRNGDYAGHKAVLDRMMETLEWSDGP
jgi:hypothetical protein